MIIQSLNLMWQGMLSIFIAITVIFLAIMLLHLISKHAARHKENREKKKLETAGAPADVSALAEGEKKRRKLKLTRENREKAEEGEAEQ